MIYPNKILPKPIPLSYQDLLPTNLNKSKLVVKWLLSVHIENISMLLYSFEKKKKNKPEKMNNLHLHETFERVFAGKYFRESE